MIVLQHKVCLWQINSCIVLVAIVNNKGCQLRSTLQRKAALLPPTQGISFIITPREKKEKRVKSDCCFFCKETKMINNCQESKNPRDSYLMQLPGGQESFLVVIKANNLVRMVPIIYLVRCKLRWKVFLLLLLLVLLRKVSHVNARSRRSLWWMCILHLYWRVLRWHDMACIINMNIYR